jgi:MGT family glycosyltransferase
MHGRHIAIFPLYGKAHIFPFLGLCAQLKRRGYRITLATVEPYAEFVAQAGIEPVIFETDPFLGAALEPVWSNWLPMGDPKRAAVITSLIGRWHINSATLAAKELEGFYKENSPDLIIYELATYAGRILAKRLGVPAVQFYPGLIQHNGRVCWEGTMGHNPQVITEFSRVLDAHMWAQGIEEPGNFWHAEALNLYQMPREVQFDSETLDSRRFCFVGPFMDRPFKPMWENRSGGKPIILVSAISDFTDTDYFNKVIDALADSPFHVILSIGTQFPLDKLRPLPANFSINERASHIEILPHVALHVYSGGTTSTLENFYFGVPQIAIPSWEHNNNMANRLVELGLALKLSLDTLTSQMLRDSVEAALRDEEFLSRVKHIQHVLQNSGGSALAADKIEEALAAHATVT